MTGVRQSHPLRIDTTITSPACLPQRRLRIGPAVCSAMQGQKPAAGRYEIGIVVGPPRCERDNDRRHRWLPTDVPRRGRPSSGRPTPRGRHHATSPQARIPRREAHRAQDCSSRVSGTARVAPSPNSPGCAEENGPARSSADWPAATFAKPTRPWVCRPVAPGHRRARRYSWPHRRFVAIDLADGSPSALLFALSVLGGDGATARRRRLTHRSARRRVSWTVPTVGRSARYTRRGCARSSRGRVRRPGSGPGRACRACGGARPC